MSALKLGLNSEKRVRQRIVRDVITSFLESALDTEWALFEETRMENTGLTLRPTPQFTAEQWGRKQPDWVLVSQQRKRIAIVVDLCRPSDVHPAKLLTAAIRKQQKYLPLLDALSHYSEQGWTIHVFPWAVGIRGMIKPMHVHEICGDSPQTLENSSGAHCSGICPSVPFPPQSMLWRAS